MSAILLIVGTGYVLAMCGEHTFVRVPDALRGYVVFSILFVLLAMPYDPAFAKVMALCFIGAFIRFIFHTIPTIEKSS